MIVYEDSFDGLVPKVRFLEQKGLLIKDTLVIHSVEDKRTWIEGWPLFNTQLEYASSVEDIRPFNRLKSFFLIQEIKQSRFFLSSFYALLCLRLYKPNILINITAFHLASLIEVYNAWKSFLKSFCDGFVAIL